MGTDLFISSAIKWLIEMKCQYGYGNYVKTEGKAMENTGFYVNFVEGVNNPGVITKLVRNEFRICF